MADGEEIHEGTVLWFKPESGQGAVKADNGRHFRFDRVEGVHDISRGLRVRAKVDSATSPPSVVLLPASSGRREFGVVDEPTGPKKPTPPVRKPGAPKPVKKPKSTSERPAVSPGEGRRASNKIATPKKRMANGAFPVGMPVVHPIYGGGFVVLSTSRVARVRFLPSEEQRQVQVADLTSLEGGKK